VDSIYFKAFWQIFFVVLGIKNITLHFAVIFLHRNRSKVYRHCSSYLIIFWLHFIFFLAVTSQEKTNCKPGRCPAYKGGRICPEQFEIDNECASDFECTGNKKCCSDGCELKCSPPASGNHLYLMFVMLLWVYIRTGQAWKICLANGGNRTYTTFGTNQRS
jgi:hypothetical protein